MAAAPRGGVTAHIARVSQDQPDITTLILTDAQVLELLSVLTIALRERAAHKDGYHLAIRKADKTAKCQSTPPCEGGSGRLNLVRPGKRAAKAKA